MMPLEGFVFFSDIFGVFPNEKEMMMNGAGRFIQGHNMSSLAGCGGLEECYEYFERERMLQPIL